MPPPIMPEGVARVAVSGRANGGGWTNVFHTLNEVADYDAVDLHDYCSDIATEYQTTFGVHQPDFWELTEVRTILSDGDTLFEAASGFTIAGALTGLAEVDTAASVLISWSTGEVYRGGKPRTYIAGAAQEWFGSGRLWESSVVTGKAADAAAFLAGVNGLTPDGVTSVTLGVLHYFEGGHSQDVPPAYMDIPRFNPYTGARAQQRVCTQRRRLGREL